MFHSIIFYNINIIIIYHLINDTYFNSICKDKIVLFFYILPQICYKYSDDGSMHEKISCTHADIRIPILPRMIPLYLLYNNKYFDVIIYH